MRIAIYCEKEIRAGFLNSNKLKRTVSW